MYNLVFAPKKKSDKKLLLKIIENTKEKISRVSTAQFSLRPDIET